MVYINTKGFRCVFAMGGISMDYKEMLIELLTSIENVDFLEFVYIFVKRLKENWGI